MVRVARMYYEHGDRQPQIAEQLHISQAKVSRLLKRAEEVGIIRVAIQEPRDGHSDLEEALTVRYGLADAIVVSADVDDESNIISAIGAAAAGYLGEILLSHERIGVSSWSATLLAIVNNMPRAQRQVADTVVQVLGGFGEPTAQVQATRLAEQLAAATGASPLFLAAPGFVSSAELSAAILSEPYVAKTAAAWSDLTVLLAGIGSLEPSPLLRQSGNSLPQEAQSELLSLGAVGDVCLRFFDTEGQLVSSPIDERVVGISPAMVFQVPRRIGVAGGKRKHIAIRAALLGGWINVLVTDTETAKFLVVGGES